jgi:hypothetical protein
MAAKLKRAAARTARKPARIAAKRTKPRAAPAKRR